MRRSIMNIITRRNLDMFPPSLFFCQADSKKKKMERHKCEDLRLALNMEQE